MDSMCLTQTQTSPRPLPSSSELSQQPCRLFLGWGWGLSVTDKSARCGRQSGHTKPGSLMSETECLCVIILGTIICFSEQSSLIKASDFLVNWCRVSVTFLWLHFCEAVAIFDQGLCGLVVKVSPWTKFPPSFSLCCGHQLTYSKQWLVCITLMLSHMSHIYYNHCQEEEERVLHVTVIIIISQYDDIHGWIKK